MPVRPFGDVVVSWCRIDPVPTAVDTPLDGDRPVRIVILARPAADVISVHNDGVTIDMTLNEAQQLLDRLATDLQLIKEETHAW